MRDFTTFFNVSEMIIHPKRRQWIQKRLFYAGIVLVVLLGIWIAIRYRQQGLVQKLKVDIIENPDSLEFIREEDVRDILFEDFGNYLEGQAVGRINVSQVEDSLSANDFIESADVYVDAKNQVHVSIKQKEPLVRVIDVSGETYYLDKKGERFPTTLRFAARVLTITGDLGVFVENFREIDNNRLRKAFALAEYIHKNVFLDAQIEQLHIEPSGEAILVPKLGNHNIYFGQPDEDIQNKFERLEVFYKEGLSREGWDKYQKISLAFKGQVVAKKR